MFSFLIEIKDSFVDHVLLLTVFAKRILNAREKKYLQLRLDCRAAHFSLVL